AAPGQPHSLDRHREPTVIRDREAETERFPIGVGDLVLVEGFPDRRVEGTEVLAVGGIDVVATTPQGQGLIATEPDRGGDREAQERHGHRDPDDPWPPTPSPRFCRPRGLVDRWPDQGVHRAKPYRWGTRPSSTFNRVRRPGSRGAIV